MKSIAYNRKSCDLNCTEIHTSWAKHSKTEASQKESCWHSGGNADTQALLSATASKKHNDFDDMKDMAGSFPKQ